MLHKRIIGVITVKDGWAVQSFGYNRYLPLGRPEILAKNLDRWGCDEILLLCIDRTARGQGPDLALIERVAAKHLATPLIYAGGVDSAEAGVRAVQAGADRVMIDALLPDADKVAALEARLGAQALIAALPLSMEPQGLCHRNYRTGALDSLAPALLELVDGRVVSEVMAIDWRNEGGRGFDSRILDAFPLAGVSTIAFGGLHDADQVRSVLGRDNVVAASIGNFLNYREHAIRQLKLQLGDLPIRAPSHQSWTQA